MLCFVFVCMFACACATKPNIIIILADDLGFNDVGFHGSNQIPTPNIDALAYSGLVLQNYYVTPICTPSRAALMTAKYPIHTGMQHSVIYGMEPRGLPLSEKILPEYFRELGYKTHLVGKWHLGHYRKEYLPLNRGFDSHVGFWTGKIDLYDHTNTEQGTWGYDFRRGFDVADDLFGQYATDIYTKEAIKVIEQHNQTAPLFLMVSHSAVHSGNEYEFIRAPDDVIDKFSCIKNVQRRKFAGVLSKLDESVGKVVQSLQKQGLLQNSIILFSTDNGGAAAGFNDNAASNYPLRGVKNTPWEGGVRGAGLLWSPLLNSSRVATQTMHITDWLPTLYGAAGGDISAFKNIDGIDLWHSLLNDQPSPRTSVVHNIDDIWSSAAISVGHWKLIKGTNYGGQWDGWYGPGGRQGSYDVNLVFQSNAADAINKIRKMPNKDTVLQIRDLSTVKCNESIPVTSCQPLNAPCLYDVEADPCERQNLAADRPDILQEMLLHLERVNQTAVPPNNKPLDHSGDPKLWGRVYTNFLDYDKSQACPL